MKTIVIAADFSKESDTAAEYALEASKVIGARVVLFHLHTLSVHAANARLTPSAIQESIDRNRNLVEAHAAELSSKHGAPIVTDWSTGDFYTEIKRVVDQYDADLLVMGMARKSIEQDLLGNTTTAAISRLKVPVLAIPDNVRFTGIKRILFACDITRGVHARVLDRVRAIALGFGAEVEIFHVSDKLAVISDKESRKEQVIDTFGDGLNGIKYFYKNVSSNAVIQEIQNEIQEIDADMLVMVPYKYGFWGSLVHKSKTRSMASGTSVPLLSIPI